MKASVSTTVEKLMALMHNSKGKMQPPNSENTSIQGYATICNNSQVQTKTNLSMIDPVLKRSLHFFMPAKFLCGTVQRCGCTFLYVRWVIISVITNLCLWTLYIITYIILQWLGENWGTPFSSTHYPKARKTLAGREVPPTSMNSGGFCDRPLQRK